MILKYNGVMSKNLKPENNQPEIFRKGRLRCGVSGKFPKKNSSGPVPIFDSCNAIKLFNKLLTINF